MIFFSDYKSVQKAAARLVSGARRHDHITPVLVSLHWLPVRQRLDGGAYVEVSVYMMQPIAIWLTCVCRPIPCMVASNSAFHRRLGLYWSRAPGQLPVSAALPSMDHEYETVCQLISERQIRLCAPSRVISRPTCFSTSLRCY